MNDRAYVQRAMLPTTEEYRSAAQSLAKELRAEGFTWLRVTELPEHGVWVMEGWKRRPEAEPPFEPLLTTRRIGQDGGKE
jgi:hypothetical protein